MKSPAIRSIVAPLRFPRTTLLALCISLALAGLGAAPVYAEDTITPEKIEQMKQEFAEEMKKLSPEERKHFEELMVNASAGGEAGDADALPERDENQLEEIDTDALDGDDLKAYIKDLQPKITEALSDEARERAELLDAELQGTGAYLPSLRAAANGLAAWGILPEATYLMGKTALASGSAQDLSNLAAFLSMLGAEPAAFPILYTLAARYPDNATLLNNLAQARYGLGDIDEAEKLLTAAVRSAPRHPQANLTLARIQAAHGQQPAAQASLHKALQGGFSVTKEQLLSQAGGELKQEDVPLRRAMPQDPLGLHKFTRPAYPKKAMDLPVAIQEWRVHYQSFFDLGQSLQERYHSLPDTPVDAAATRSMPLLDKVIKLQQFEGEHYRIAEDRLRNTRNELSQKINAEWDKLHARVDALDAAGREKYRNVPGGYQFDYTCGEVLGAIDDYLTATVPGIEQFELEELEMWRKHINETTYLSQFVSDPAHFEKVKLLAKKDFARGWGQTLLRMPDGLVADRTIACFGEQKAAPPRRKLADFDDLHCQNLATLDIPGLGKITSRCSILEAELDPALGPLKAKWATQFTGRGDETRWLYASAEVSAKGVTVGGHSEFDEDGLKSGGLSVGIEADVDSALKGSPLELAGKGDKGPLEVEVGAKVSVTGSIEFDRTGITDIGVKTGLDSKASSTIAQTEAGHMQSELKAGVNSTWSWNSGFSGNTSGNFDAGVFDL